jgi:CRP/FNR family transcriptional regulator, cyclic AMP receptor protein
MNVETARDILSQNPWFSGLPQALANDIVRSGRIRRLKNAAVFAVGDEPNGLFAVLSGEVHISHTSGEGRLALLLIAHAGNWFGETSVLDGGRRYSDALAAGACELLHLDMGHFSRLATEHVSNYAAFTRLLCEHHRLAMDHISSLDALPVVVRLAQRLLFFSRPIQPSQGKSESVRLSQEELASAVGVSRQALSVHLKDLEQRGAISIGYKEIKLRRRALLEKVVNTAAFPHFRMDGPRKSI